MRKKFKRYVCRRREKEKEIIIVKAIIFYFKFIENQFIYVLATLIRTPYTEILTFILMLSTEDGRRKNSAFFGQMQYTVDRICLV